MAVAAQRWIIALRRSVGYLDRRDVGSVVTGGVDRLRDDVLVFSGGTGERSLGARAATAKRPGRLGAPN